MALGQRGQAEMVLAIEAAGPLDQRRIQALRVVGGGQGDDTP